MSKYDLAKTVKIHVEYFLDYSIRLFHSRRCSQFKKKAQLSAASFLSEVYSFLNCIRVEPGGALVFYKNQREP